MIIDCISDLHGHYPELEGGDLLIVAGDLTAMDTPIEHGRQTAWMQRQKYTKKILIAGNHDNYLCSRGFEHMQQLYSDFDIDYLCDSGTEFVHYPGLDVCVSQDESIYREKIKIWGSPWTLSFPGMNPNCKAFTVDTEDELAEKWALIPDDTDILVTHSPPWGSLDQSINSERFGSTSLSRWVSNHANTLKLHVFGHIHEGYGMYDVRKLQMECGDPLTPVFVNAAHVNRSYQPVNKPIRIEL